MTATPSPMNEGAGKPGASESGPRGDRSLPFEFSAAGEVTSAEELPLREGVRIFVRRYASEWALWHRSGCRNLALCDVAAFNVAAIHCYYLDPAPWSETRGWLVSVFGITEDSDFLAGPVTLPARALDILRRMRPKIEGEGGATDDADLAASRELLALAGPIEHLFVRGGDQRLTLNPQTLLNGYGCRPYPRPEAITFSSSTASSISAYAYNVAEQCRQALLAEALRDGLAPAMEKLADRIRRDIIKQICGGRETADVVLCSSGTDCFLVAQGLVHLTSDLPLVTLIVGANESGTGVPLAARERHFAAQAALGEDVAKGEPVHEDAGEGVALEIPLRDEQGRPIAPEAVDASVRRMAEEHVAAGAQVLIHAMNHSKLGASGPSVALLLELKGRFGDKVQIVIDACQMRVEMDDLRDYLLRDFPVIITGSKFFTGPPLSGAVLVSRQTVERAVASKRQFPKGFNAYCARFDFPASLRGILSNPSNDFNLGSYMRWVGALAEIKRYFRVPPDWRKQGLDQFGREIRKLFQSHDAVQLQSVPAPAAEEAVAGREFTGRQMIFPFFLVRRRAEGIQVCDAAEARTVYELLNQDCSERFLTANARDYRLLAQRCHIGQPVKAVHPSGLTSAVVRLSMGARIISESWSEAAARIEADLIRDEIWQAGIVLDKITLLLKLLDAPEPKP
ncbi:MAG TPA: hypothetical protein VHY09_03190 [Candidatus Methylacidiphilales bacterium]|jgi:hypothetical protein|nr:hypothetical protein [Candidatus Methylacidiphilales bacterium]